MKQTQDAEVPNEVVGRGQSMGFKELSPYLLSAVLGAGGLVAAMDQRARDRQLAHGFEQRLVENYDGLPAYHAQRERQAELAERVRRDTAEVQRAHQVRFDPSVGQSTRHGMSMLQASPSGRHRLAPQDIRYAIGRTTGGRQHQDL